MDEKYVENQIHILFDDGGFIDRFNYFVPRLPESSKEKMLISGCAIGTECAVAQKFGFKEIVGTEITPQYVSISNSRFQENTTIRALLVDGKHLPFPDQTFTCMASGHIIEHTHSPFQYLREHLRVLRKNGTMFLEFPTRYHRHELHTGLPSLEWLPLLIRNPILWLLHRKWLPTAKKTKRGYEAILNTLQPVSAWQIRLYLFILSRQYEKISATIVHKYSPAPGYVRMMITRIR